jgi:WD40 repeat protein
MDENKLLHFNYNHNSSCFAIGTEKGFIVYDIEPFRVRFKRDLNGGIGIVEMLDRSNVLALVGGGPNPLYPPYKVMIWDDYLGDCVAELVFQTDVKGVNLSRKSIFVVLETLIYEYDFSNLEQKRVRTTFKNPTGIMCINSIESPSLLITLGEKLGEVCVISLANGTVRTILAHDHPVSQMCLNENGTKLATASERGTKIRVFNTTTLESLHQFTRGSYQASISSLSFNKQSSILVLTSNTGTSHIFYCDSVDPQASLYGSWIGGWTSMAQTKSVSQFSIPKEESLVKATIINGDDGKTLIIVLGSSGTIYKYHHTINAITEISRESFFNPKDY